MISIKLIQKHELVDAQNLLNSKGIIAYLGGFTMMDKISQKQKQQNSLWAAFVDDKMVGVAMIGGRPQSHIIKYGEIAVLPEFRRMRVASSLYFAMTIQGIIEGRRLFEDTIVGDNPTQFFVLPTMGLKMNGELEHKTASAKSICIFQFSMLWDGAFEKMLSRVPSTTTVQVAGGEYADDLYTKNCVIYSKYSEQYLPIAERLRNDVLSEKHNISVVNVSRDNRKKTGGAVQSQLSVLD